MRYGIEQRNAFQLGTHVSHKKVVLYHDMKGFKDENERGKRIMRRMTSRYLEVY